MSESVEQKIQQQTCSQIIAEVERQAREGVRFPISEARAIEQQLQACVQQGKITQAEFNAVIQLMKNVDTR